MGQKSLVFSEYFSEHEIFTSSLNKFLDQKVNPFIDNWEEKHYFPDDIFETLGKEAYLGLLIPEVEGGIGADYDLAAAWCETFGRVSSLGFTIAVNMHSMVITPALSALGSKQAKDKFLQDAIDGKAIGAYAFTEPDAGSDLSSIRTTAKKKGNDFIINGSKTFITNGARASFILVLTKTDQDEFTTFIVDTSLPGFKVNRKLDKLGWHCSDTAEISFENLKVSSDYILGTYGEGWKIAMNSLNWERLMLSLTTLGSVKQCFRETMKYCEERKAFGKFIIEHDLVEDMLAEMYRRIRISESLTYMALERFLGKQDCRMETALAKKYVADNCAWVADRAIQLHGGYGYTTEFKAERWWREIRLMAIGGGTSEIMGNIVSKAIFSE